MENWIVVLVLIVLLSAILGLGFYWRHKMDENKEMSKSHFALFGIGMAGWSLALVIRIIPLQLLQAVALAILGADLLDPESVASFSSNFLVIVWGPLLAGIFEGGCRYLCFILYKKSKQNPKHAPFFLGLGWTAAEIILLYFIPLISVLFTSNIDLIFGNSIIGFYERLIASAAHIIFSYFAFYALFEAKSKKFSLLLSMGWHFLLDFMIVLWIIAFPNLAVNDPYLYLYTLEGVITVVVAMAVLFWFTVWFPRCKKIRQIYIENENTIEPTVFKPPATKEDIAIDLDSDIVEK